MRIRENTSATDHCEECTCFEVCNIKNNYEKATDKLKETAKMAEFEGFRIALYCPHFHWKT